MHMSTPFIPADVPAAERSRWLRNMSLLTRDTRNVYLFAADQKVEHVLELDPQRIVSIAQKTGAGALATHLGLLTRIDDQLRPHEIPYVVKLNGKTNLIPAQARDPFSTLFTTVEQVAAVRDEGMPIVGVGYTLYPGSFYEDAMLHEAAQCMYEAHRQGLVGILWIYPRGEHISDDTDGALIARGAGLAPCLGADMVKIKVPHAASLEEVCAFLARAQENAGNVRVLCSGGAYVDDPVTFLTHTHAYIHQGQAHGCAVGRNLFQRPLDEAYALDRALSALLYEDATLTEACALLV